MLEVPINGFRYLKRGFNEVPFLMWNGVYLFLLILTWSYVGWFVGQFSLLIQLIILGAIPIFLWIYEAQKPKTSDEEVFPARENRIVPSAYPERLKELIPNNQIELFEAIFLPVLAMFYSAFSEIGAEEYFSKKQGDICKIISFLKGFPELYTNQQSYKNRDRAITAFCFFRTLFRGAVEEFQEHSKKKHQSFGTLQDIPWLLIKRVPTKLGILLGSEYWRIYEFWIAVYGDIENLKLNADAINYLRKADELIEIKNTQVEEKEKQDLISAEIQYASTDPLEDNNSTSINSSSVDTELKAQQIKIAEDFIKWLENKINSADKSFSLNDGEYVFISPLEYGKDSLFITNNVLDKYSTIIKRSASYIIQSLKEFNRLDNNSYFLKKEDQEISVFRINSVLIQREARKAALIKEVITNGNFSKN